MIEIVSCAASMHHKEPTEVQEAAIFLMWSVCLVALVAAIVTAVRRRRVSSSYSGDIVLAVFSPFMYWILFAAGAVSHA